ncbi:MAG: metallophosphoesterase [Pseudomonadota bacterium]
MWFRFPLIFVLAIVLLASAPRAQNKTYQWVQPEPGNKIAVRLITSDASCPELTVEGRSMAMARRVGPIEDFPEYVCELELPQTTTSIALNGRPLPTFPAKVERIAVIGDTGCRIRFNAAQACNDPDAWPLRKIIEAVAQQKPDLVIHVGDFVYRSMACPPPVECEGSPYGDKLETWVEDWIDPAQQIFSNVPVVLVRGNHENCGRGGRGWFRYFASGPYPRECAVLTEPWKITLDGFDMIVFDASDGRAPASSPEHLLSYRRMAEDMFSGVTRETWFLTHRPLWVDLVAFGNVIDGDDTQRAAFGAEFPEQVSLILSGHIHAFQAIDMANGPVQGIAGNSGARLDPMPDSHLENIDIAGSPASTVINDHGFGFLLLTRSGQGNWQMDAMDENGKPRRHCRLEGRSLTCIRQTSQ